MNYIKFIFIPISQLFPDSLLLSTNQTSCSFSLFQEKKKTKLKPKTSNTNLTNPPKPKKYSNKTKKQILQKKNYGVNFVLSWAWDLTWELLKEEK